MAEETREQFEKCYPPEPWAIRANGEAGKAIHFSHLKREWEGFQKGWQAALAHAPRQSEQWMKDLNDYIESIPLGGMMSSTEVRRRLKIIAKWAPEGASPTQEAEWITEKAKLEDGADCSAGSLSAQPTATQGQQSEFFGNYEDGNPVPPVLNL